MAPQKLARLAAYESFNPREKLGLHFSTLMTVRGYVKAATTSSISPVEGVNSAIYDALHDKLTTAQEHANAWVTLDTAIVSTVPEAIIVHSVRFQSAADTVLNILNVCNNAPDATQRAAIQERIDWLSQHLAANRQQVDALAGQFKTFQDNAATDLNALSNGEGSIQALLDADNQDLKWLDGDIDKWNAEAAADRDALGISGAAAGVGLFVGVAAMALSEFTMGASLLAGGFLVFGSAAEAAAVLTIYSQRLAAAEAQLRDDLARQKSEGDQVIALGIIRDTINHLTSTNAAMGESLTQIADWWQLIERKYADVQQSVTDAAEDASNQQWSSVAADLTDEKQYWQDLKAFATSMQIAISTSTVTLVKAPSAAALRL